MKNVAAPNVFPTTFRYRLSNNDQNEENRNEKFLNNFSFLVEILHNTMYSATWISSKIYGDYYNDLCRVTGKQHKRSKVMV